MFVSQLLRRDKIMACGIQSSERFVRISSYAKRLLTGSTLEEIAKEDEIAVEDVKRIVDEIENINPCLYMQLKDKL